MPRVLEAMSRQNGAEGPAIVTDTCLRGGASLASLMREGNGMSSKFVSFHPCSRQHILQLDNPNPNPNPLVSTPSSIGCQRVSGSEQGHATGVKPLQQLLPSCLYQTFFLIKSECPFFFFFCFSSSIVSSAVQRRRLMPSVWMEALTLASRRLKRCCPGLAGGMLSFSMIIRKRHPNQRTTPR